MKLGFGHNFKDLKCLSGLKELDSSFLKYLKSYDQHLHDELIEYRKTGEEFSEFLIQLSYVVDDFISKLFKIEQENDLLKQNHEKFDPIYECRRKFIQRYVVKKYSKSDLKLWNFDNISLELSSIIGNITEAKVAKWVLIWQNEPEKYKKELNLIAKYCAFMFYNNSSLPLFDIPRIIDSNNHIRDYKIDQIKNSNYLGYDYRKTEDNTGQSIVNAKYCIYCHKQKKDSCAHGMKYAMPEKQDLAHKKGCPLKQKISEMNVLKSQGFNIASLAIAMIDNPFIAVTGHRICNDCMKACIFQKQTPVNIPLIESEILEQTLSMSWGVEIYMLFSRWNPLNVKFPLPLKNSGNNILVVGLGPAGFTLSCYLLNQGHRVTAIDGLKISPLEFDVTKPIKDWKKIKSDLSKKIPQGFGGVAEYGITHRWDKNNLTLIRLILERNESFQMFGGVRLGSNITTKQAFDKGFDHIALCTGAGKPKYFDNKNYFIKNIRPAADFLMSLQQGGEYLKAKNSKLFIRLPAIVIGCGLTAIDSAVELLQYYPIQVEKILSKIEQNKFDKNLYEQDLVEEFIEHAKLFRNAKNDEEKLSIINDLGGVTICYRGDIKNSPAYRLNHEEIEHAMAIGVGFKEHMEPKKINSDENSRVESITFSNNQNLSAKSVLIAIGTNNNEFLDIDGISNNNSGIFKNREKTISHFGDCNVEYAGSVVKAIASVKNNYQLITHQLSRSKNTKTIVNDDITTYVTNIKNISDELLEITVKSSFCAENYQAGQIFRLQNFDKEPKKIMDPIALTPINVDKKNGLISFAIFTVGRSTNLCRTLSIGDEIVLMGPTASPFPVFHNKKIIIISEWSRLVLMLPIMSELKKNNCNIICIASNYNSNEIFYKGAIEPIADEIIYSESGDISRAIDKAKTIHPLENTDHVICNLKDIDIKTVITKKDFIFRHAKIICNLNTSMQCMMKGICGRCIKKTKNGSVFACLNQFIDSEHYQLML